ncbi:hypothetical protein GH714_036693 [Hevea brasiliensis]|uniref:Uncharacterized protein n=1 Tax=Hevea brasiliensis TaxID=3981 RepID=A0A6A6MQV0_HEVBR|nr:hypothetical protein GH714_036693 [Hevea brasiliensis]
MFLTLTTLALPRPILAGDDEATRTVLDPHRVFLRIPERRVRETKRLSGLFFNESIFGAADAFDELSALHKAAKQAWLAGKKLWEELESADHRAPLRTDSGSHITVVGSPRWAHLEKDPKIALLKEGEEALMVSQFMMELLGLKTVDGEEPPRIIHFNPRLKGDWSGKPVIEHNTGYRMQWGTPLRCEGWSSQADEDTGGEFALPAKKNMYKGVSAAYVVIILTYWQLAFCGYWAFGSEVQPYIVASLTIPEWTIVMANLFAVI